MWVGHSALLGLWVSDLTATAFVSFMLVKALIRYSRGGSGVFGVGSHA